MTPERREEIRKKITDKFEIPESDLQLSEFNKPLIDKIQEFALDVWDEAIEEGAKHIDRYTIQHGKTFISTKPIADAIRSLKSKGEK